MNSRLTKRHATRSLDYFVENTSLSRDMLKPILHGIGAYAAGELIGPAKWPHHDLIVVREGTVNFSLCSKTIVCRTGDALLIPPLTEFRGMVGSDGCVIWVQHFAKMKTKSAWPVSLPLRPFRWSSIQSEWARTLMKKISVDQSTSNAGALRATVPHLLTLLIQEFQLNTKPKTVSENANSLTVRKTIAWLEAQSFPLPPLKEIANYAGWSVSHLRNNFRNSAGRSIGKLIRELEMNEASRLLQETAVPIKAIAARVGYSDVVAFHRAFRRHNAVTPSDFRRRIRPVF